MKKISLTFVFVLVCSVAANAKSRVPGTKVSIDPPVGFEAATQFPGFLMQSTDSSILVTPMEDTPFSDVSPGFDDFNLASKGMSLVKKTIIERDGGVEAVLLHVRQRAYGSEFQKWMLIEGNEKDTCMVVASFPTKFEDELSESLKECVLTSVWDPSISVGFFEGLTFKVGESGDLKYAKTIGNNVILTKEGQFPKKESGDPFVVVGSSITQDWSVPGNLEDFAIRRLQMTATLREISVEESKSVEIDGLRGVMIFARGEHANDGTKVYIEQCLLFTPNGYYIFQAVVGDEDKLEYIPYFKEILDSFDKS